MKKQGVLPASAKKRGVIGRSSFIESKPTIRSTLKSGISSSPSSSSGNIDPDPILNASRANDVFNIGEKIYLHGLKKWGVVKYFGDALFSDGKWVGVELHEELGRNDGTVQGHRYFTCKPKYGVFVRPANCSRATNVPTSSRATPATPNVRMTPRLATRASLPNSISRSSTQELRQASGSELDSIATQPDIKTHSSSDLRGNEERSLLSDDLISQIADRILTNDKFRQEISAPTLVSGDSAIDVSSRLNKLEDSLLEISKRMSEIQDMMTGISKPPRRSLSTSVSWEDVQVSSADELDSLKSALAMVASLAKQAHDATLVERQNHTERIKQLEEQLQFAAESKEEPSPAPSS